MFTGSSCAFQACPPLPTPCLQAMSHRCVLCVVRCRDRRSDACRAASRARSSAMFGFARQSCCLSMATAVAPVCAISCCWGAWPWPCNNSGCGDQGRFALLCSALLCSALLCSALFYLAAVKWHAFMRSCVHALCQSCSCLVPCTLYLVPCDVSCLVGANLARFHLLSPCASALRTVAVDGRGPGPGPGFVALRKTHTQTLLVALVDKCVTQFNFRPRPRPGPVVCR